MPRFHIGAGIPDLELPYTPEGIAAAKRLQGDIGLEAKGRPRIGVRHLSGQFEEMPVEGRLQHQATAKAAPGPDADAAAYRDNPERPGQLPTKERIADHQARKERALGKKAGEPGYLEAQAIPPTIAPVAGPRAGLYQSIPGMEGEHYLSSEYMKGMSPAEAQAHSLALVNKAAQARAAASPEVFPDVMTLAKQLAGPHGTPGPQHVSEAHRIRAEAERTSSFRKQAREDLALKRETARGEADARQRKLDIEEAESKYKRGPEGARAALMIRLGESDLPFEEKRRMLLEHEELSQTPGAGQIPGVGQTFQDGASERPYAGIVRQLSDAMYKSSVKGSGGKMAPGTIGQFINQLDDSNPGLIRQDPDAVISYVRDKYGEKAFQQWFQGTQTKQLFADFSEDEIARSKLFNLMAKRGNAPRMSLHGIYGPLARLVGYKPRWGR